MKVVKARVLFYFTSIILARCLLAVSQDSLTSIIEDKEQTIHMLVNAVNLAYNDRCNYSCLNTSRQCIISACGSLKPTTDQECLTQYGNDSVSHGECQFACGSRRINPSLSSVLVPNPNDDENRMLENCWTSDLNERFRKTYMDDLSGNQTLRWQYFATTSGIVRLFPAITQQQCFSFDPRIRPWYVAATSGPKDVILVLDVSASMLNYGRLELARQAARTVVETLTNVDYVTVVLFNDNAQQLLVPNQIPGSLLQGTYLNIEILTNSVQSITANPFGGTNFEAALNKVFDILDNVPANNSANCHTAILFLTDGFPNKGSTSQQYLVDLVEQRNTRKARIFTYTFGSLSGAELARDIACATNGVYAHINDHGNLREQMSQYYDYFAAINTANADEVTWVEPYADAVGAGILVTASKAVYTNSTPRQLIGVVGVDVLVTDLEEAAKRDNLDHTELIRRLASRNACPVVSNLTTCELDAIRVQGNGETCSDRLTCDLSPENNCSEYFNISYCNYTEQRYEKNPDSYREESCCFHEKDFITQTQCRNRGTMTAGGLMFIVMITFHAIVM